jgi:hypothetical protein
MTSLLDERVPIRQEAGGVLIDIDDKNAMFVTVPQAKQMIADLLAVVNGKDIPKTTVDGVEP